jgi:hypothetical protein
LKQVFLIATHHYSEEVLATFSAIGHAAKKTGDTFLLYHEADKGRNGKNLPALNMHRFTDEILYSLDYIPLTNSLLPGSNHFSLLHFFQLHPGYHYYWYIEDDVRFTGSWELFFDAFKDLETDFISAHLDIYTNQPGWPWWDSLTHENRMIPEGNLVRSFNPVYRISARALAFLHDCLRQKWRGHHEVLIPTLLHNNNFSLMDFGGTGYFAPPGFRNRFYTDATYRWKPVITEPLELNNKLYHPVKPAYYEFF